MPFNFNISWGFGKNVNYRKDSAGNHIYNLKDTPKIPYRAYFNGDYSDLKMIEAFKSIPEVFAGIDLIADRVSKGIWELVDVDTEEVDYKDPIWNRIKEMPNWKQPFDKFIYNSEVYRISTGNCFIYKYIPKQLSNKIENISQLWLLPPQFTTVNRKSGATKFFYSTSITDLVESYTVDFGYERQDILPEFITQEWFVDVDFDNRELRAMSPLRAAEMPINNLNSVYQARFTIYDKRGMMGMFSSRKTDDTGVISMSSAERKQLREQMNEDYGVTGGRDTIGITNVPVEYLRTGMSIQELEPFEETFASTAALFSILGIPRSFVPTKQGTTFNNGFTDEKKLYTDVIIPAGESKAKVLTKAIGFDKIGKKIRVRYDHVPALQQDQKINAETEQIKTTTYQTLYNNNNITKNEMLVELGFSKIPGADYYAYQDPNKTVLNNTNISNNPIEKPIDNGKQDN